MCDPYHIRQKLTQSPHPGRVIAIFAGAVWAYILLFVFLGPEMTQEERDEEAALTNEFEQMRAQGVSLAEIGAGRVKKVDSNEEDVEAKPATEFVEKV